MKCSFCDYEKDLKPEKKNVKYDECGLDNIIIVGATYYHCPNCGEGVWDYGNIIELHNIIKSVILQKASLMTGPEIKFLRKNSGLSKEYFAELLGVDERTIYRWEKGLNITKQVDHAIRMAIALTAPDRDYEFHDYVLQKKKGKDFDLLKILRSSKGFSLKFA